MTLQADITAVSPSMQVDSTVGLPGTCPFALVIDPGNAEEVVDVTSVSGTTLAITRAVDGTPAQSHPAGVVIRHMATARDFRETQEHIGNTVAHGTVGDIVGTGNTQALTNKDLTAGTNTFPASLATDTELAAEAALRAAHAATTAAHGAGGAVVGLTNVQALTNKDLTSATNTFPSSLATDAELSAHAAAVTGVHGVTGNVVGTTGAQTLTNKTMSGASNTFSAIPQSAVTSLGIWIDYTTTVRTDVGASAAAGTAVQNAQYMKIGNTVFVSGEATTSALVSNCSIMLPLVAGTPSRRFLDCGSMVITNSSGGANAGQLGIARMTTGLDRVLTITDTNAFCDAPAGSSIQWHLRYEVA